MRNIVVCCDGTWNTPDEEKGGVPTPTNVAKMRNALVQDGTQLVYYHPGVGTGKGWWDRAVGGGTGAGLDKNIMSAYAWLGKTYQPNDRIFFFGFSRGAYTARSCSGLVSRYGLLDLSGLDAQNAWDRVTELFAGYRAKDQDFANPHAFPFHNQRDGVSQKGTTPVFFIGVWDTVGALGIPSDFALLGLLDDAKHGFHDTTLSETVANARHAVALDERRASFAPTFWTKVGPNTRAEQLWFPGVHSDVGGGYPETGLSDGALKWMMDEAKSCELRFHDGIEAQLAPDALAPLHDSNTGIFDFLKSRPRSVPALVDGQDNLHGSTLKRLKSPTLTHGLYWPTTRLAAGGSETLEILARRRWNATNLFLEKGVAYDFAAEGEWIDQHDAFPPDGSKTGFAVGDVFRFASDVLGRVESVYKSLRRSPDTDFWYTRRIQDANWFALIGFIANDEPVTDDDDPRTPEGETFVIGRGVSFTPKRDGYLYCFANDAWQTYENNRGSVTLRVTRP